MLPPPPPPHEFDAVTSAAHREGPHRACVRYAVDQSLVGAGGSYSRPPAFIVVPGLVCGWKNHIVVDLPFGIASKLCNCSILAMAKGKGGGVTHVSFLSELTLHYDPHVEDTPRGYESYTVREVCQHIHWLGKRAPIRPVWLRVLLDWDDGTTDMFECAPTYYRTDVVAGTALCSLRHNLVDEYWAAPLRTWLASRFCGIEQLGWLLKTIERTNLSQRDTIFMYPQMQQDLIHLYHALVDAHSAPANAGGAEWLEEEDGDAAMGPFHYPAPGADAGAGAEEDEAE